MPLPRLLQPRLVTAHLLALVLVAAAGWLGLWQLEAWQTRREAQSRSLAAEPPVPLEEVMGPDDPFPAADVGRPVLLDGRWVGEATFYVSGRRYHGRDGYWAVTPLALAEPRDTALLVVRGWTADPADAPSAPTGTASLVAWLQPGEGSGVADDDPTDDVVPRLRIADAVQRLDQDLYGAYAVVAARAAVVDRTVADRRVVNPGTAGLARAGLDQQPQAGRFTAVRNLFYAVEWWIFGCFAGFVWWRYLRDELAPERARHGEPAVPGGPGGGGDDPVPSVP